MSPLRFVAALAGVLAIGACATGEKLPAPAPSPAETSAASATSVAPLPSYLVRLAKDGDLYARVGDRIVDAPADDIAVLRGYPAWADKGALSGAAAERLTILAAKTHYAAGEEVRVVHVHEATKPGLELYVMGPKAITGEYVDGVLASPPQAPSLSYDGAVVPSPGADHNFEVSHYRLAPGAHTIEWRYATLSGPAVLRSNVLHVEVR